MTIDAITSAAAPAGARVSQAHAAMNAAYNALALDRETDELTRDLALAREYVTEARDALAPAAGQDGLDDAHASARAVLPRLEHALTLLDALGTSKDPHHVAPLLDELGLAMDHVEATLAGIGWD